MRADGVDDLENLLTLRVHGGVDAGQIAKKICEAEEAASRNRKYGLDTIVFFDEANATAEVSNNTM